MPLFQSGDIVCGRFAIDKLVGVGGMSEVYRGHDAQLRNRTVAIKALRSGRLAHPPAGNQIIVEVRSLARLNHPHIATLYDVCRHGDFDVLIMEFLEGTSLSAMLKKSAIPHSDVLRYALQISDALGYAHRHGVIHRDVKPANIVVTPHGAKLLDFGIAHLRRTERENVDETEMLAVVAGTPSYMSPEQRAGQTADHRSDIYSFGILLVHMLTGDISFNQDSIASKPLRLIIKKCLESEPDNRWASAGDLQSALTLVNTAEQPVQQQVHPHRRWWLPTAIFALLIAALVAWFWPRNTQRLDSSYSFLIAPPAGTHFVSLELGGPPAISPDGRTVAFVAAKNTSEETSIWLLPLNAVEPTPLHGTEGASHAFWSPDNQSLGFFSGEKLKRIDLPAGTPIDLCDAQHGRGGAWSKDQVIIFTPDFTDALYKVPASGGKREKITNPNFDSGETSHRWPLFLPDGRRFVFFVRSDLPDLQGVYLGSLDDPGKRKFIGNVSSSVVHAQTSTGDTYLLFSDAGFLMARRFIDARGAFAGDAVRIAPLPFPMEDTSVAPVSASNDGAIVYGGGSVYRQLLQWVDRHGNRLSSIQADGQNRNPRLSPDMRRVAMERMEIRTGFASLWIFDLDRELQNPFEQLSRAAFNPVWSSDGTNLLYSAFNGLWDLTRRSTMDKSDVKMLRKGGVQAATDWAGGNIIYQEKGPGEIQQWDIGTLDVATGKTKKLLATEKNERQGRLSPDGKWLAYTSNDFAADQVFIARFPEMFPRIPVSEPGSNQPLWSEDGQELFYIRKDRDVMSVRLDTKEMPPRLGKPEKLFTIDMYASAGFTAPVNYDVDSRRGRFLIAMPPHLEDVHQQLTVRLNWLKQKK